MDTRNPQEPSDAELIGRRVVALLPPSKKDRTKHLLQVLEAAKARWDWRISATCLSIDQRSFRRLVERGGRLFVWPHLLKTADWERDPEQHSIVEQRMREAERTARLPVGRIVLAGAHSVGRAFNVPVRHTRHYALVRRILSDNTEPARIVRRLFRFADDMLEAANPDLVYAFEWATPPNYAVWLAAQRRGIPCVALRYSKINPDHAFWTTDRLMLNTAAVETGNAKRRAGDPVSEAAKAYIGTFCDQPRVINYIATKWRNRMQRKFLRWHLESGRIIGREFINNFRGQDRSLREPPFGRFVRYYRSLFLSYWHQRYLLTLTDEALAAMKYVYFPMHKEAELAQTFQATLWHDQRNTIRVLASLLPAGYRLFVREHRMNYGHRPTRSYRQLSRIPNVTLIDPFDSQFKYLRHADLVVTENGSSGWEGLLLGRRVLLLSDTFYDGAGLGRKVTDPDQLNAAILDALARPAVADSAAHDHALGSMIDGELETTFRLSAEGTPAALELLKKTVGSSLRPRQVSGAQAA